MASFPSPPVDVPPYYSGNATAQRVYRLPPDETAALNTRVMAAARTGDYEEGRLRGSAYRCMDVYHYD
jgi:hypothetical protein